MPVNILKCQSLDLSTPALTRIAAVNQLLCDRLQYADDERCVHIYANLAGPATGGNLIVAVAGATRTLPAASNKLGLILDISSLAAGDYAISCHLEGSTPQQASFTKLAASDRTIGNPPGNPPAEIPDDGIPLRIAEIRWPDSIVPALGTHALVPLPRKDPRVDVAQLRVYENGKIIPSQTDVVGTWDGIGTPRWLHVFFTAKWDNGLPRQYRLRATGAAQPANRVAVDDTPGGVEITSSQARVSIPRPFTGIRINGAEPSIQHVVDEHGKHWTIGHDATVAVESQGAALAVVKIAGTYRDADGAAGPWQFTTRIRISADSPLVGVQHSFQWKGSAVDATRIADLAFRVPCRGASKYALGLDGKSFAAPLPAAASVFAHQERDDRVTGGIRGQQCDGWFCLATQRTDGMTLFVKEFWQRFPQELEFGHDGFVLHSWPLHGRDDTYPPAEQMSPQNFHRGLCFHSGRLLTLKWPPAYADTFNAKYRNETDPGWDAATQMTNAKAPALSFTTEFAVLPSTDDPASWNALFLQNPLAMPSANWLETAQPMTSGPIAAQGTDFPEIEAAVKRAVIGFFNLGQLSNFTGKFNYGETHHAWVLPEDRPSAYRTCYSNHYYSLTTIFTLYLRSGDPDLLALGRRVLNHAVSVDAIRDANYAGFYHKGIYHWAGPTEPNGHHADLEGILLGALVADDRYALDGYKLWLTYFWNVLYCELAGRERDPHCDLIRLVHLFQQEWDVRMLPAIRALAASLMQIPFAKQTTATWHPTWMSDYWRFTRDPAMAAYLVANTAVYNPGKEDGVDAENRQGLCPGATTAAHWHLACQEITGDKSYSTRHFPAYDQLRYATVVAPGTPYDGYGVPAGQSGEGLRTLVWPYLLHSLRKLGVTEAPSLAYGCYPVVDSSYGFNDKRRVVVYILKTIDEAWTINLDNDGRNQDSGGVLQILSPRGRPINPYTTIAAAIGDGTVLNWLAGPKFDSPWVFQSTALCVDDAYAAAANYGVASVDSPTRISLTTPAPLGRRRIDFYDHGVAGEGNVPYCRVRFAGYRRAHAIPADRELGLYRAIWGGGPCGMLAPLSVRADGKSHWQEAALIPAGSSASWGCTQGWLLPLVGGGGRLVFTATEFAATVIVKDFLGNVLLDSAMLATPRPVRGLATSATVVLSRNGPWHLQVLSGGVNSATSRCDQSLLFAPIRADVQAIRAALS
jgi:hypothetical protein